MEEKNHTRTKIFFLAGLILYILAIHIGLIYFFWDSHKTQVAIISKGIYYIEVGLTTFIFCLISAGNKT